MKNKLPKQWKDWCAAAHLTPHGPGGKRPGHRWWYLKGHGRLWRVNCHMNFQCGDTYADFDRWALCDIQETPLPQTKQQFVDAVASLLKAHGK